jgi:nucleoside-diphosphate-sugar epimerase
MKILVTGATGFTGKRVLPLLKDRADIVVFARMTSDLQQVTELGYEISFGDLDDLVSLRKAMTGCQGLINIASLGFGHAKGIIDTAVDCELDRALFISTTALFTQLPAPTKRIREDAEKHITESCLNWTILRPTMIYGDVDDRNMFRLLEFLKKSPIVPVPGDGKALQQPIHVKDLARAIVDAFFSENTHCKAYNLSGATAMSFDEIIDTACFALQVRRKKIHFPLHLVRWPLRFYEKVSTNPRLKEEQVLRLDENKAFSHNQAREDFGFSSRHYSEGIHEEAKKGGLV